jgi:hypothetical protein
MKLIVVLVASLLAVVSGRVFAQDIGAPVSDTVGHANVPIRCVAPNDAKVGHTFREGSDTWEVVSVRTPDATGGDVAGAAINGGLFGLLFVAIDKSLGDKVDGCNDGQKSVQVRAVEAATTTAGTAVNPEPQQQAQ